MMVWEVEEKKKRRGMRLAEGAGGRDVQIAREVARQIWYDIGAEISKLDVVRVRGYSLSPSAISMDDVRHTLSIRFPDIKVGNWAGSVFRRPEWEPVGWTQSTHKGGHRRAIRTWRLA